MNIKLTSETRISITGETLYRIEATKDIPSKNIKKGEKGGFIASLEVYGNARVSGDAWVYGNAQVYGNARVSGDAWVYGNAQVYGDAWVYGNAQVYGDAQVYGNARVSGDAWVYGNAQVYGDAWVYGNAQVYGDAHIDSLGAIIVLCIAMKFSVTVTRKLIFIGCQAFTRKEINRMTKAKAIKIGLPKEYFKAYQTMVKGALMLVKEKE